MVNRQPNTRVSVRVSTNNNNNIICVNHFNSKRNNAQVYWKLIQFYPYTLQMNTASENGSLGGNEKSIEEIIESSVTASFTYAISTVL